MGGRQYLRRGVIGGIEWISSHSDTPQGLAIVPPLIGGHALGQLRLLRPLVKQNIDLLSFSYAGHGASSGSFSLQASKDNCTMALDLAIEQSRRQRIPLFSIASCYAAIPMLHALRRRGEPLVKMVLINALPHFRWENILLDFLRFWRKRPQWRPTLRDLKSAMRHYQKDLLPNLVHHPRSFGILSRDRVQWRQMIKDLFAFRNPGAEPLQSTPVLCVYGRRDRLLQQIGFDDWSWYEDQIKRLCPQTRFWRLNSDHFLTDNKVRHQVADAVTRFFLSEDLRTVPN